MDQKFLAAKSIKKFLVVIGGILVLWGSLPIVSSIVSFEGLAERPPQWDQAAHALDAIHFAQSFLDLDPIKFFVQLHNSALWPPAVPLFQSFYMMLTELNIERARESIAYSTVFSALMLYLAGVSLHRVWGVSIGLVAAFYLLVSPGVLEYSSQVMLEVPGIALSLIPFSLFCLYIRGAYQQERLWNGVVISSTILFFTKFNYVILVFFPMLVHMFVMNSTFRRPLLSGATYLVAKINWRSPFSYFLYFYTGLLAYIQLIGIRFEFQGHIVQAQSAFGNPIYFLALLVVGRQLLFYRREFVGYLQEVWLVEGPLRSLVRLFLLPIALWMMYPPFFSTFFRFIFNQSTRQQSFFSLETLTFYPSAIVSSFSAQPWMGWILIAGLIMSILQLKSMNRIGHFLVFITAFNMALLLSHPNYQVRYMTTILPFLILLSLLGYALALDRIVQQKKLAVVMAPTLGALIFVSGLMTIKPDYQYLHERFQAYTNVRGFRVLEEKLCAYVNDAPSNAVLGFTTHFNPASIGMACYDLYPNISRHQLPTTMTRFGFHGVRDGQKIIQSGKIKQLIVVDYSQVTFDPGKSRQESYLLPEALAELKSSDLYRRVGTLFDPESGLHLTIYRHKSLAQPGMARSKS